MKTISFLFGGDDGYSDNIVAFDSYAYNIIKNRKSNTDDARIKIDRKIDIYYKCGRSLDEKYMLMTMNNCYDGILYADILKINDDCLLLDKDAHIAFLELNGFTKYIPEEV